MTVDDSASQSADMNHSPILALITLTVGLLGAHVTAEPAPIAIDPAFTNKFPELRQTAGFIEQPSDDYDTEWKPNLQLWVGVKAVEGKKQAVYFVQLTTLATPATNIWGEPWQPDLRTNDFAWSGTNKSVTPRRAEYVHPLYPVRARVFDSNGRAMKEGQTPMAWGMLTNGLLDMCRLSLELIPRETVTNKPSGPLSDEDNDQLMSALGGGFMWMAGMFSDFQTVPSVADVWKKAQCAIRMPSAWSMIKGIFAGFSINLQPRLNEVTVTASDDGSLLLYRLPLDLMSRKDKLTDVEIVIGPARGAEMLMSGIRSIHAVHPSRSNREFLAQVLATGSCPKEK